jgi:Tol biopolymer transport system component
MPSRLEVLDIRTGERRTVLRTGDHIEAPNWAPDGSRFVVNGGGQLFTVAVDGTGGLTRIDTGEAVRCNNDHGFSPDGTQLAVSHQHEGASIVYVVPADGGTPRRVTEHGPSYWHGWSPDGRTLAYTANRSGQFDIYTIDVDGGPERRLTSHPAPDDGPDYSPDGSTIFYNSERSGVMRV